MKRITLFLIALMILSFGLANAQDKLYPVPTVGAWDGGTKVSPDGLIRFEMWMEVGGFNVTSSSNGWEIYLSTDPNGATFIPGGSWHPVDTTVAGALAGGLPTWRLHPDANWTTWYGALGAGVFLNPFATGMDKDTFGIGGFSFAGGIPAGTAVNVAIAETMVGAADAGNYLCIDTAWYRPNGKWLWATADGNKYPQAHPDGGVTPQCWLIEAQPNMPAEFTNLPGVVQSYNHCNTATFTFTGVDPDPEQCDPPGDGSVTFSLVSGIGSMSAAGVWSYSPTLADVGSVFDIEVRVEDACGAGTTEMFQVQFTNVAPTVACQAPKPVGMGNPTTVQINGNNVDCDPGTYSITDVQPHATVGVADIDPNTGLLTFNTVSGAYPLGDGGVSYTFEITYSDGDLSATCSQVIDVLTTEPFEVQIQKTHGTYQGVHEYVDVYVNKGSEDMWGFDFLIGYDASALSFQSAMVGDIYTECGWEYFNYTYSPNGNCGGACPSGYVRVIGIAETNNGPNYADCFGVDPGETLFSLDFLVTNDRTFECQYVPIYFYWFDCGDNTISYHESSDVANPYSQTTGISRFVYNYEMLDFTGDMPFPTMRGANSTCETSGGPDKPAPIRFVDFIGGGIDIICADSIDAPGDLNLNGIANEIGDATLYSNYFVFGPTALSSDPQHYQAQVAASDVNGDGYPLSVADLVYLIRVIEGNANATPKIAPVNVNVVNNNNVLSVNETMGAAFVIVEGNVHPQLLAEGVEMKYNFDAEANVTRVLVIGLENASSFEGAFLNANGTVKSIEMATFEGAPVNAKVLPSNFVLNQNYPNPFNPSTAISFMLPQASDFTITVYNVTGQVVATHSDRSEAGTVEWTFDASELSSGIYFYNVVAGDHSATKKMVLIK